jgi:hypothetical protein
MMDGYLMIASLIDIRRATIGGRSEARARACNAIVKPSFDWLNTRASLFDSAGVVQREEDGWLISELEPHPRNLELVRASDERPCPIATKARAHRAGFPFSRVRSLSVLFFPPGPTTAPLLRPRCVCR